MAATETDLLTAAARILAGNVRAAEVEKLTTEAVAELVRGNRLQEIEVGRWATPAQLELEREVLESWREVHASPVGSVDAGVVRAARREMEAERGLSLTEDQAQALAVMTGSGAVVAITGDAGTGKGVAAQVAVRAWERSGHRVLGIANANANAQRLEPLGVEQAMSVHMLLNRLENGRLQLDGQTVLVLDEATMVDTENDNSTFGHRGTSSSSLLGSCAGTQATRPSGHASVTRITMSRPDQQSSNDRPFVTAITDAVDPSGGPCPS